MHGQNHIKYKYCNISVILYSGL